jgi:hypothetical protein
MNKKDRGKWFIFTGNSLFKSVYERRKLNKKKKKK